ncbi:hypothetical protein MMC31_007196 [Peltigera leucophlebia]|nr:hypothetical protein [Peltigera leucophlebia]
MFGTFPSGPPQSLGQGQGGLPSSEPSAPAQRKRNQVARACDWCRVHRIKCDNNLPCSNCLTRGEECSNKRKGEAQTLPAAIKEIDRLRQRVKELEEELKSYHRSTNNNRASLPSPSASPVTSSPVLSPGSLGPLGHHGASKKYWEGIHTSTTQSHQTQYYGPSSSFYFIGRISSYLGMALQQPHLDHHLQPNAASRLYASPTSPRSGNPDETSMRAEGIPSMEYLTGTQEDYFLGLFWQSYHCTLQIVDEVEFKEHYRSLWTTSGSPRKPSALVDIILAICMQYGVAFAPRSGTIKEPPVDVDGNDATIAGRWLYRRSQTLLSGELESPSIMTLQCYIFSVYYLCIASFQNMAHTTLSVAVRTAHILGLHLEPPENLPRKERELRKRLWWTLYTLESKTCMKLGRPWSAQLSHSTCSLPADDYDLALLSASNFASFGENVTWLTYSLQNTKLCLAARAVYIAFYDKCADVLGGNDKKTIYNDSQAMESCAQSLLSSMQCLQTWIHELPDGLKTKRKGSGEAFSTDKSPLELELFAPMWLQRQRLLLELLYHNLAMNLYRPFISFSRPLGSNMLAAEGHTISCVNHAISLTHIMHQVLTETDMLNGWHEAFQWQWNAALSLVGFILAYPLTPSSSTARNAINNAISVFERFGNNFAVALSAANVTRDLTAKADFLTHRLQNNLLTSEISTASNDIESPQTSFDTPNVLTNFADNDGIISSFDKRTPAMTQNPVAGPMDLAFSVDSFNGFEPPWEGGSNMSSMWGFPQE